jgi:uncharacterized protein YceH (UPF0502 family)
MDLLNDVEVRVLGSLAEKEITTPEYYPLSLNALTTACNQTSNRNPVVHFEEATVADSVERLRQKNLVHVVQRSDSRVVRYRHVMADTMKLERPELAVMVILMLRGAQTVGELRTRSNRIFDFPDLEGVETALNGLIARNMVTRLSRQTGQKEVRYAHLLSGEVSPIAAAPSDNERIARLEEIAEQLRKEMDELRDQLQQFRKQFE